MEMTNLMLVLREKNIINKPVSIDFDVNLIVMNMCRSECTIKSKADELMSIMKAFSSCKCVCTPVFDLPHHHHSKRASVERRTKKLFQDVRTTLVRYELTQVSQKLNSGTLDSDEAVKLQSEKDRLTALAKKGVGCDFELSIDGVVKLASSVINIEKLNQPNGAGGSIKMLCRGFVKQRYC